MRYALCLVLLLLCTGHVCGAVVEKNSLFLDLTAKDILRISLPAGWIQTTDKDAPAGAPTVIVDSGTQVNGLATRCVISLIDYTPLVASELRFSQKNALRDMLDKLSGEVKGKSVEKTFVYHELSGPKSYGVYFLPVTDSAPNPGEWLYLTQGFVMVDGRILAISILSNEKKLDSGQEFLGALATAIFSEVLPSKKK
jgi:hypothetical protein